MPLPGAKSPLVPPCSCRFASSPQKRGPSIHVPALPMRNQGCPSIPHLYHLRPFFALPFSYKLNRPSKTTTSRPSSQHYRNPSSPVLLSSEALVQDFTAHAQPTSNISTSRHYSVATRVLTPQTLFPTSPRKLEFMSIENLKTYDPFAEADEDTGETKQAQNYIHIRIQQRNGRKTLTTVQGLPKKFDQKKILKVIKKKFACNGTIVNDTEMGEVIQLQGDQRGDVQKFLIDKREGLDLDAKTIKVHGF
ncbi:translation initiation factor SUI1 [Hypoxylon sp. FL1284]|nr:translation initiation factor SUI1 [Hypoxylon sp. FL1284]